MVKSGSLGSGHRGCPILLVAFLSAVDPWLSQFPRELGRRLMEFFLRSVLIGYMTVLMLIPLLLIGTIWLLIRARGQRPVPTHARPDCPLVCLDDDGHRRDGVDRGHVARLGASDARAADHLLRAVARAANSRWSCSVARARWVIPTARSFRSARSSAGRSSRRCPD